MENKNKLETECWVEEKMALLAAPDEWEPDADAARIRLQVRLSARRPALARVWLPLTAAAVICFTLIFAIPTTRALTRQLWWRLTLQKVEVVQGDFQKLGGIWLVPQSREIEIKPGDEPPPMPPIVDFTEAARRAGFIPRLPREGAPHDTPELRVWSEPMVWSTTLNVAKMEASLRQAGVFDLSIPKEWDGVQLSFTTRSMVSAVWGRGELGLGQHPPITISAPDDFDLAAYWTAALRAAGVGRWQAHGLAERMITTPSLLLGIATNNKKAIREVQLRAGPATLIEDLRGDLEHGHVLLMWGVSDRMYHLTARTSEQAITAANSIE